MPTARFLTVVYGLILVVLAVIPRFEGGGYGPSDWVLHGVAYGILGGLLWFSCGMQNGAMRRAGTAVCGAAGFGLVTEMIQLSVSYRSFEVWDLVADTGGALVVVLMLLGGLRIRRTRGSAEV